MDYNNNNTGNSNTGDWNTGNRNTGNRNTGNRNTGDWNTGDWNTGNRNTGNWNTGNWNTGNWNTGYFNNTTPTEILVFGKPCNVQDFLTCNKPAWLYFGVTKWINIDEMTEKEKSEFKSWEICGGYLRKYEYQEAAKLSWDNASHEDKMLTYQLPNFDADIAKDIFGIDFKEYLESTKTKCGIEQNAENIITDIVTINGIKYKRMH